MESSMCKRNIIFISKDALRCEALPVYGNTFWKTPNIDELASKGTLFMRHYTAAASTAMAFTSMAIGKYCYETNRKLYNGSEESANGNTIFDTLYASGYDVHIAWDLSYENFANTHFKCEGKHTTVHSLDSIIPHHSPHIQGEFDDLAYKDEETNWSLQLIIDLFRKLSEFEWPVFLWLHLPHVFAGRNAYDSDIDIFDKIIGYGRTYFHDDEIFISADHGHMNGHKGKFSYGFDLEESAIRIPLITPKFCNHDTINFPTTTTQLLELFGICEFVQREIVIIETAYYVQPMRKIAIIHGKYKLVYSKEEKIFFLYDLEWDKNEDLNLYYPEFYDIDRTCWYSLNQRFYYPYWADVADEKKQLVGKFNEIWKNGNFVEELKQKVLFKMKRILSQFTIYKKAKTIINIGK
jgi:arylsulfatase A-like enzyme